MRIKVIVTRNESHPEGPDERTVGTFDWLQLTYQTLRLSPDGDDLANFTSDGYWELEADKSTWSDLILEPVA